MQINAEKLIKLLLDDTDNNEASSKKLPFKIGETYFVRTVTYFLTGRLVDIVGDFLVFEQASMIGDTGRFNEFFKSPDGNLEVEPFGDREVYVNSNSIVDAAKRELLLEVK